MKVNQRILACIAVAVVFGGLVASVKADDLFPPTTQRAVYETIYSCVRDSGGRVRRFGGFREGR